MCLKKDQTEGRIIFVQRTISCFSLPVPSEYASRRKEKGLARHICLWVGLGAGPESCFAGGTQVSVVPGSEDLEEQLFRASSGNG